MRVKIPFLLCLLIISINAVAQQAPTEFQKGWFIPLKIHNGVVTTFKSNMPDVYVGGVGINPQVTVAQGLLRAGANATMVYNNKKISGLFGPMLALKLTSFQTKHFGSYGNIQLIAEANWGTSHQSLVGGGLAIELLNRLQLALTTQRDYKLNNWWLQTNIAIKLNKKKSVVDEYSR